MGAMAGAEGGRAAGAQRGPMAPLPALGGAGRLRTAAGRRRPSVSGSGGGGAPPSALSMARRDGGDRGGAGRAGMGPAGGPRWALPARRRDPAGRQEACGEPVRGAHYGFSLPPRVLFVFIYLSVKRPCPRM